ncbi:ATP-binding response regulator [Brotaphodocola sp.]|uniref:ATP-binding response regulator n=1 Tax=Brotaphodocola sp. TaxID=3073577 RepID=UPI003D7C3D4A
MEIQKLKKKMEILEQAFVWETGVYYNVNLTKNVIPGIVRQVVDGKEYSVNERIGLPINAKFTDLVTYWEDKVAENEREDYLEFFRLEHLLGAYRNGETHLIHTYWTQSILFKPMLAQQHLIMFEDEENGDVLGISYILDRTKHFNEKELNLAEQKLLEEEKDKAVSANEMKSRFLSSISHDIRTPINGIQGMLRIADAFPTDMKKQGECREKMWIATNYLVSLVNNVLNMNHLENKSIDLKEQPFNLIDLLMSVTAMADIQTKAQGLHGIVDWKPGYITHRYLIGSAEGLSRILMNLNSNAIKYNKKGGSIYCRCKEVKCEGDTVWIELINADTGIGMSEEFLKHAFEAYSQANNTSLNSINGVGLGLSIVKQTVEMMGGTLEVESKLNEGTKYTILLPFKIDPNPQTETKPVKKISLKGVKALLVEDNDLNLEIAKFHLEQEDIEVFTAVNGQEAIEMFEKSEIGYYDIILMDIMMPIMNGLEATRHIRSMNRADAFAIPIIAMSANAFEQDIQESLEAGMNAHLVKPMDGKKITDTMRKFLANRIQPE